VIEGVKIFPLTRIPDDRGTVFHMLKVTDPHFLEFGEIYFSSVYPGVVKGWHIHERMTINYACVSGGVKVVIYDDRDTSPTSGEFQEVFLGADNYSLLQIPPKLWNGFTAVGSHTAIVANCATHPHDPAEIRRLDPHSPLIPYDWNRRDG
jgi:dTDP-4-dehydrorhamnose 3,5-epimerase